MSTTASIQLALQTTGSNAGRGTSEAYTTLVQRYRGELVNQALAILGSLEDAEDVVQESFCELFRSPKGLAEVRSLGALLRSINRANALNRLRDRRREAGKQGRKHAEAPERFATTGGFSMLELRDSVAKAIESLPEHLRVVVALRYWEHLSYQEIAQRLQLPEGTVGRQLYEASMGLFERLKPHLDAGAPNATSSEEAPPPTGTGVSR